MGDTITTWVRRPVKLQELMIEQDGREEEQLGQGFEIRAVSRTLSEFLQEGELNTHAGLEAGREEEKIMDGFRGRKWRSFKERLKLRGMGCCGSPWNFGSENMIMNAEMAEDNNTAIAVGEGEAVWNQPENGRDPVGVDNDDVVTVVELDGGVGQNPAVAAERSGGGVAAMNLAAALAAERHFRAAQEWEAANMGTPLRVSLMRLLEEGDGGGFVMVEENGGVVEEKTLCCVCLAKHKGAAFIPCGHTFCRVCSRELWLNRGSCPLCNRSIIEILDIF